MPGEFLLDTNIVIAFQAGEQQVVDHFSNASIYIPAIVIGELLYDAYGSQRQAENLAAVDRLAQLASILPCDDQTARHYGMIKSSLRAIGKKIPENDIWIAAIAKQYDLTLATRDAHFDHVNDLSIVAW